MVSLWYPQDDKSDRKLPAGQRVEKYKMRRIHFGVDADIIVRDSVVIKVNFNVE